MTMNGVHPISNRKPMRQGPPSPKFFVWGCGWSGYRICYIGLLRLPLFYTQVRQMSVTCTCTVRDTQMTCPSQLAVSTIARLAADSIPDAGGGSIPIQRASPRMFNQALVQYTVLRLASSMHMPVWAACSCSQIPASRPN